MKIYLVVDSWQYDGGFTVEAAYINPDEALIEQQRLRRGEKARIDSINGWGAEKERHTIARCEAIHIEEVEVK